MRIALAGLGLIACSLAHAEQAATVRVGDHPGFGRVVFDMPAPTSFQLSERGGRVAITFSGAGTVGMPDSVPRNVVSVLGGEGSATLTIVPGARIRAAQMGNRIVIDVLDPAARARPAPVPAASPATPAAPAAPAPAPAPAPTEPAASAPPAPSAPAPAPRPAEEVKTTSAEPAPSPPPPAPTASLMRVPAAASVGVAAFRRGDLGVVVFDERVAIEAAQLENAAGFGGASVREAGKGTMLIVPMAEDAALVLAREPAGWVVKAGAPETAAVDQVAVPDGIAFPFAEPGRVLTVRDPYTGQTLLIGTSKAGAAAGRAVPTARRAPGYVLLPTWLGLAFEPSADQVALRASLTGFTLVTPDSKSPAKTAEAVPENRLGLPTAPLPTLQRQLRAQIARAASLPARARGGDRVAAARTMLALGMASEAQALLALASEEDPAIAGDPSIAALSGMAAVLAGRPAEAAGLDAQPNDATEDVALWRGLRDAAQGKPVQTLGRAIGLLNGYPEAVRNLVLPVIVEAGVREGLGPLGNERMAKTPKLAFARALQAERDGKTDEALAGYDALEKGRDWSDSVRAAIAGAELRLAKDRITPAQAADIVDRQTLRWRGDGRELAARLRTAELRVNATQWRAALEALRETETVFPDAKADVGARKAGVFKALASGGKASVGPLDLVTLAGDYADCMPEGSDGEAVAALLADKLIALDLPSRAAPVLQRLLAGAKSGRAKAEFALALAQIHLDLGEPLKAETVLKALDDGDLSSDRAEGRTLLLARARAGQGDSRTAAQILAALASPAADDLRATLSAQSGDWQGSLQALNELASKLVPADGELNDKQQDLLFRQAVAAVQAGDADAVKKLGPLEKRLTGPRADQFRVLTATAVQSTSDLPRSAGELAMSRSFSGRLDAGKAR